MNDLAMVPLTPKVKKLDPVLIYRCGVARCPEILGELWPDRFSVTSGYVLSSQNLFIKTRRAAGRNHYRRAVLFDASDAAAEQILRREGETGDHNPEDWGTARFLGTAARDREYSTVNVPTDVALTEFPVTFVCARCGRQTKINGDEFQKRDSHQNRIKALR